jgi:anti-sigma factor RsiW
VNLERELTRHLAAVEAPDSLWACINRPQRKAERTISWQWSFWPAAAVLTLAAVLGVWRTDGLVHNRAAFTDLELVSLARGNGGVDYRSDDFTNVRIWAKNTANVDIDLPAGNGMPDRDAVHLIGARLIRLHGVPCAAIDYQVGDDFATLLVSGRRAGLSGNTVASKHLFSQIKSEGDLRILSWNMRNETYAIAFSGAKSAHAACLLCHNSAPPV